jgi:hypothetical protein
MIQSVKGKDVATIPLTVAEVAQLLESGNTEGLLVDDYRCRNLVTPRQLSVRYMPRKRIYRFTYKVAMWWRSAEFRDGSTQSPFYLPA